MGNENRLLAARKLELSKFRSAKALGNIPEAWIALERAHILSQSSFRWHLRVHVQMLAFAVITINPREFVGQAARIALVPLGSLTGRIPIGNTGRSNVSAFRPMPLPADLQRLLSGKS